jgi:hypothetical protein
MNDVNRGIQRDGRIPLALTLTAVLTAGAVGIATSTVSAGTVASVDAPLEVTQSSAVTALPTIDPNDPVTSSLNLAVSDYYSDLDLTAEVTLSGTDPGALVLDQTGLTLTVTTETDTSIVMSGSASDIVTALESQLEWETPESPGTVDLSVEVTQDLPEGAFFNSSTGHLYLADSTSRNYDNANSYASGLDLWGTSGHLATITTETENNYLKDNIDGSDLHWLGGGDNHDEGEWEWKVGPDNNDVFFEDTIANRGFQGTTIWGFVWWGTGEPDNDFGGCVCFCDGEDRLTFNPNTSEWFDQSGDASRKVLVEFSRSSTDDPSNDTLDVELTVASRHAHLMDYADNNGTTTEYPSSPDAETWTNTGATLPSAQPNAMTTGVGVMSLSDEEFATALNTFLALAGLSGEDVDTLPEVQAIIDAYQQLRNYIETGSDEYLPDASLYEILGFGTLNPVAVGALNSRLLRDGLSAVESASDLLLYVEDVADIRLPRVQPRPLLPLPEDPQQTTDLPTTR